MQLIGLTGPAGCGKDTIANFLMETHGFVQIALADPLRDGLKAMLGVTDEQLHRRDLKEAPIDWIGRSPRELLQTLGTEWGREHVAADLWLHDAAEAYCKDIPRPLKYMLPDYQAIEARVEAAIRERFKLPAQMSPEVKRADLILLATERRDLMPADDTPWPILEGIIPLERKIAAAHASRSQALFIKRWVELTREAI